MNTFPVPFRIIATILLSGILVFVGILNFRDRALWTIPSDGVLWTEFEGTLQASEIQPDSPADNAGILPGDRLYSINGIRLENIGEYSDFIYQAGTETDINYRLENSGAFRDIVIRLIPQHVLSPRDGLRAILAFLHLGIGLFILFRGQQLSRSYHFYYICLAAFVVYLYSFTTRLGPFDWWVYTLSVLSFLCLPALFVHFCLRFPVHSPIRIHPILIYLPGFILILMHGLWITGNLAAVGLPRTPYWSGWIDNIELGYFCIGFVAGGFLLLWNRFKTLDITAQQQMKWIGYGTLAGVFPFSLFYVLPTLAGVRSNLAMEASMLFLAFIPLSIGYAIIRFRLMDVENIARRSISYFSASSLLLAFYLLFVLVLGRAAQWIAPQADFIVICMSVLLIALLFAPLRNTIQLWLDRRFYKDRFEDRSSLVHFARKLSSEMNLEVLSQNIADRVSKAFDIQKTALFLADPVHRGFFRLAYSQDSGLYSINNLFREEGICDPVKPKHPVKQNSGSESIQHANPVLRQRGFLHVLDLKLHGRRVGYMALGRMSDRSHFSTEDLELLTTLAGYAAMALENANLYRSVENKALELERMKAYTENIIESINVAVIALDPNGIVTSCNRTFEKLFAASRGQVTGVRIENLFPEDIVASIHKISGTVDWKIKSPGNMVKLYLENKAGKHLFVNLSFIPLLDSMERNSGSLIVLDDITEKAEMEKQLLQSEKLSSIGLLAAGVAHEINTPIAGISSYTQMLLKDFPESNRHRKVLEKIESQTFRAAEIISGLLNFSRLSGSEFSELDINQLIHSSLTLLNHQFQGNHIKVESKFDPSLPTVYGNSGKLQQVFINLFLNAKDAMPSGGNLLIETGMNDSMVIIDISDNGMGISEENRKKIFDPFFTTKTIGKGTGLGLSVSYGIIQEHGGRILVDSNTGEGTRFKLKLPTRLQ
ncbi:MAG: ATP-binding protein [Acidobacteriota bacterium]